MKHKHWTDLRQPDQSDRIYELFHENSKRRTFELQLRSEAGDNGAEEEGLKKNLHVTPMHEISLALQAPTTSSITGDLSGEASLSLTELAQLLIPAYGTSHTEDASVRPIHSEGNRWPVELYVWHPGHPEISAGLYYFNPEKNTLALLPNHDDHGLNAALEFTDMEDGVYVFITALFNRSTGYFGERGYRYCCLEAGQIIGHLRILAGGLGLNVHTVMEFHDRRINAFIGIDGVTHATLSVLSITK